MILKNAEEFNNAVKTALQRCVNTNSGHLTPENTLWYLGGCEISKQDTLYYHQTENAAIGEIRFLGQEAFI